MGKGTIIANLGDGYYSVQCQFNRIKLDKMLQRLIDQIDVVTMAKEVYDDKLAEYEDQRTVLQNSLWWLEGQLNSLESDLSSLNSALEGLKYWLDGYQADINDYREQVASAQVSILALSNSIQDDEDTIDELTAQGVILSAQIAELPDGPEKDTLQAELDGLNQQILDLNDAIDSKQASIGTLYNQIEMWEGEIDRITEDFLESQQILVDAKQEEIETKQTEIDAKQTEIDAKQTELNTKINDVTYAQALVDGRKLYIEILQKRKYTLENLPADPIVAAWCVDYSLEESGEIATIELYGVYENTKVLIRPGYENKNIFDGTRDGQLQYTKAMTPAQVFYSLAMRPGWQIWMPTYRIGTITSLDHGTNACTITLETKRSFQQIVISGWPFLAGVKVDYMECDSHAFTVGDKVLIEYRNRSADGEETPFVIGFESHPKPCRLLISIWNSEIVCFTDSGCLEWMPCEPSIGISKRLFHIFENDLYEANEWNEIPFYDAGETQPYLTFAKSGASSTAVTCEANSSNNGNGPLRCRFHSSKTLENITVHAWVYYDIGIGYNLWCISLDVNGVAQKFPGTSKYFYGEWLDVHWCSNTDQYNTTAGYKGYDIWAELVLENVGGTVIPVTHRFISVSSDSMDLLTIFDITADTKEEITLDTRANYMAGHPELRPPTIPEGWEDRHMRLVGVKRNIVYQAVQEHYYGHPLAVTELFMEVAGIGVTSVSIPEDDCGTNAGCLLNEFTDEIEFITPVLHNNTSEYIPDTCELDYHTQVCRKWLSSNGQSYYEECRLIECRYCPTWCDREELFSAHTPYEGCPDSYAFICDEVYYYFNTVYPIVVAQCGVAGGGDYTIDARILWEFIRAYFSTGNLHPSCSEASCTSNSYRRIGYVDVQFCDKYTNWVTSYSATGGSITPDGVGLTGNKSGYVIKGQCYNPYYTPTTTNMVGETFEHDSYQEDYDGGAWPYYLPFAIIMNDDRNGPAKGWMMIQKADDTLEGIGFSLPAGLTPVGHFYFTLARE